MSINTIRTIFAEAELAALMALEAKKVSGTDREIAAKAEIAALKKALEALEV